MVRPIRQSLRPLQPELLQLGLLLPLLRLPVLLIIVYLQYPSKLLLSSMEVPHRLTHHRGTIFARIGSSAETGETDL